MITQDILKKAQRQNDYVYIPKLVEPWRARAITISDKKILDDAVRNLLSEFSPGELKNLIIDFVPNDPVSKFGNMPPPEFIAAYYRSAGDLPFLGLRVPEGIFTWPVGSFVSQRAFDYVILHELSHWTGAAERLARYGVRDGKERDLFMATEEIIASCTSVELMLLKNELDADVLFLANSYVQHMMHQAPRLVPLIPHVTNEVERILTWLRA